MTSRETLTCLNFILKISALRFYRNNKWSFCPWGYFLNGLYRTITSNKLYNIDKGYCCKPNNHIAGYGLCYDEDVTVSFEKEGWTNCFKPGYYITGLYRGSGGDELGNIDKFRCCETASAGKEFQNYNALLALNLQRDVFALQAVQQTCSIIT